MNAEELLPILSNTRFDLTTEKRTQAHIEKLLMSRCIPHIRERRMVAADGKTDIPDFWLSDTGVIIEVKANKSHNPATIEQLARYAAHASVSEIILLTNRAGTWPREIEGKPLFIVSTGAGWL